MSDQPPAIDKTKIQWKEAKSKKGAPYQVGRVRKSTAVGAGGSVAVNWPISLWVDTPELVADFGITRYQLVEADTLTQYNLYFETTGNLALNYTFQDATGASYECDIWNDGVQNAGYNSNNPTIVKVSAGYTVL